MPNRNILLRNVIHKTVKDTNAHANIASLVPTEKEYKHLSDDKNINNKRTIDYTKNIETNKYYKNLF